MRTAIAVLPLVLATCMVHAQDACQLQRLVAPATVESTDFGAMLQTNGRHWIVGDGRAQALCSGDPFACTSGAVFAYEMVDGELALRQTILPHDIALYDNFGVSVALDGDRMAIGSMYTRWPGRSGRPGAVYIYEFDGEQWSEADRIQPPDIVSGEFGAWVLLEGDDLFVSPQSSRDFFWYTRSADGWTLRQTVRGPGVTVRDAFLVVAFNHDWVIATAHESARFVTAGGAVFFYRRQPDGLALEQEIYATERMRLGATAAFDGSRLLVGAPVASRTLDAQGIVQVYEIIDGEWRATEELTPVRPGEFEYFGQPMIIEQDTLLVCASRDLSTFKRGTLYRFERDSNDQWVEVGVIEPELTSPIGPFGSSPVMHDNLLLVGAPQEPGVNGRGAAYFFDLTCNSCPPDLDGDGTLTIFDYLTFLNLFQDGDAQADFDGDGELTIFDFLAFQTAFDTGCE